MFTAHSQVAYTVHVVEPLDPLTEYVLGDEPLTWRFLTSPILHVTVVVIYAPPDDWLPYTV